MRRYARWLAAFSLLVCGAASSYAATVWVSTTGSDLRCDKAPNPACPAVNQTCGRCSNNSAIICSGTNVTPCGGGGATCVADSATLGICRNNQCGGSTSLACKTIDRGAARSQPGDTVRVLPGTYHECVGVLQPINGITIASDAFETSADRTTTIVDGTGICDGTGAIFRPAVTLGDGSAFRGFTVRGGGDGGIRGLGSVVITRNVVTGNQSGLTGLGGGIVAYSSYSYPSSTPLQVEYNDVTANSAPDGGGGVYVLARSRTGRSRPVSVKKNVIRDNTTTEPRATGAGVLVRTFGLAGANLPVVVTQNTIEGNSNLVTDQSQAAYGGGIAALAYDMGVHTIDITNNTIRTNHGAGLGGGISIFTDGISGSNLHVTVSNNLVEGNTAIDPDASGIDGFGGGIWCETFGFGTETIDITGNTVRGNSASPSDGGGIAAWAYPAVTATGSHHVTVTSNVITQNQAGNAGGGLELFLVGYGLPPTAVAEVLAHDNTITDNSISLPDGRGGGLMAIFESAQTSAPGLKMQIDRNTITGNSATLAGGGAALWVDAEAEPFAGSGEIDTSASIQFRHNAIVNNHAIDTEFEFAVAGGLFTLQTSTGTALASLDLEFNTIFDNDSDFGAGGLEIESETEFDSTQTDEGQAILHMSNSIVAGSLGTGVGGPVPGDIGTFSNGGTGNFDVTDFEYNDVFGNNPGGNYDTWFGNRTGLLGNVSVDPQLDASGVPTAAGGLPAQCSGAVDRGDPALSFSAEPTPNGHRVNLGHLGATANATTSLADANGDFAVDGIDVLRVATSFASTTGQPRFLAVADFDGNGEIDGVDLAAVASQFGATCH